MQYCTRCKTHKPLLDFPQRKSVPSGRGSWCKQCCNNEYHLRQRDKCIINARLKQRALKTEIMTHYGGICACCGESYIEFLSIDHINGGGKKHLREIGVNGGRNFYKWLKDNNYPDGFRVLCMNCNFSLGHYGICPHAEGSCIVTKT